jgi:hypothetical protein
LWKATAKRAQHRQGVHNVAERARLDECDALGLELG